jgi:hypothetical protein
MVKWISQLIVLKMAFKSDVLAKRKVSFMKNSFTRKKKMTPVSSKSFPVKL